MKTYDKSWRYVAPFATLMAFLGAGSFLELSPEYGYPVRTVAVFVVLLLCSRPLLKLRPVAAFPSVLVGLFVFVVWIGPDLLWPGYRSSRLFTNFLTSQPAGPAAGASVYSLWYLFFRVTGSALLVPIVEELFWRAWLMRWLVEPNFQKVPLGTYAAQAFWLTAVLFASEHGAFWAVGLAAGIIYNWWLIRTRSLGDCILAHAVTNGALAAYVLFTGRMEYWL